ncbi:MAG: protein kinase, partial [Lacunisphaera sp.]|nr:protein kinase [Lacunisphaera sp.]
KILRPHELGSAETRARFKLEAATVATLDHPAILPVLSVGEYDGLPYYTMKLCGGSLAQRLEHYRGREREAAELVATLADAVHHAHARGVLHRDLKSGNILFDEADRPFVSDFGLAKMMEGAESVPGPFTRPLLVMGTPGYMAPEVLKGGAGMATMAADIYALGAILHELLTGAPPPATAAAGAPRPGVARDLAVITARALAAEPGQRYTTAEAFAADLRAWLAGRPIAARPVSAVGQAWSGARRNPLPAVLAAALVLAFAVSAAVFALKNRELHAALTEARMAEARSQASLAESLVAQARAVRQSGRDGQRFETMRLLRRAVGLGGASETAGTEALAALALADWQWIKRLPVLPQLRASDKVDFTPDLSLCVVTSPDATAPEVRRVEDWAVVRQVAPAAPSRIEKVGFGPSAGWLCAYYADETQAVWGPGDGRPRWIFPPNGRTVAPVMANNAAGWWFTGPGHRVGWHDGATGAEHWLGGTGTVIYGLTPSPGDRHLAVVRDDRLEVWDVAEEKMIWSWAGDAGLAPAVWSADGRWLVSDRFVGAPEIVVWDARTGAEAQTLRQGQLRSSRLALHPDGRRLLSLDSESILRVWDRWTGRELVRGQAGTHALRLSADGRRAAVGAGNKELGLIEFGPDEIVRYFPLAEGSRARWETAAVSPDDRWLLAATKEGAHVWSVATGREELRWKFPRSEAAGAFFLPPEGKVLYSGTEAGVQTRAILLRDPQPPEWGEVQVMAQRDRSIVKTISADGRNWWAENYARNKVQFWPDADPARAVDVAAGGAQGMAAPSADGRWLAVVDSADRETRVLALPEGRVTAKLWPQGHSRSVFSPDNHWLVLGSNLGYDIWRVGEWAKPAVVMPVMQRSSIYGYALFSPDSRRLAITTGPSSIGIGRTGTWRPEFVLTLPGLAQRDAWAWSQDGRTLFVLSGQQLVMAWDIPAAEATLRRLQDEALAPQKH